MTVTILVSGVVPLVSGAQQSASAEMVAQQHKLERNGIPLYLMQYLDDSTPPAKHILMVHGLTYSSHEFHVDYGDYSLVRFFVQNGYAVWLLDITGYGNSGAPTNNNGFAVDSDYAADDIAAAVTLIRDTMKVEQVDILGWSWGTVTGARMAAKHSEWVRKLVLYGPVIKAFYGGKPESAWHENTWAHAADDFQKTKDGAIDYDKVDKAVAAIFLANCWRYDGKGSPNGGRRDIMQGHNTVLFDTTKLTIPVMLIGGDSDPYLDWDALEEGFKALPTKEQSKLVKMKNGSHILMLEKANYQAFREIVLDFLKNK
jgi:pimeloyl-ACP methyl ester carboxylesterase